MAELALPILALGGLYIYSNKDNDKHKKVKSSESFTNMGFTRHPGHNWPTNLPNTNVLNNNYLMYL